MTADHRLILELMCDGNRSEEIGRIMGRKKYWVLLRRMEILNLMGADTSEQAIAMAFRRGILH